MRAETETVIKASRSLSLNQMYEMISEAGSEFN